MTRLIAIGAAVMLVVEPSMESPLSPSKTFVPKSNAFRSATTRRQCVAAAPDVHQTMIINDACNQNPQINITTCASELTAYIHQSVAASCTHYAHIYDHCLAANNGSETECSDFELGYQDCSKHVLQTYAYCGCYYSISSVMYKCANTELEMHPRNITPITVPTATLPATAILPGPVVSNSLAEIPGIDFPNITPASLALASASGAASGGPSTNTGVLTPIVPIVPSRVIATHPSRPGTWLGPPITASHSINMADITSLPPHFRAPSPGEGTRTETTTITMINSSLVTTCASTFTSCSPTYTHLSTYSTVFVKTLYYCGNTNTICASSTTNGAPKSTALPTRGGPVGIAAVFSESGSPTLTTSYLPALGEPANEGPGSSGQATVIAQATVSGSAITVYGPVPTVVDPGPKSNGIIDAHPVTGTTISPASRPKRTTLVRLPLETGKGGNEVCVCRMRKRSILMG